MATRTRNLIFNATVGVVVAALIIAGVFTSGITLPTSKIRTGALLVLLTDAPVPLSELNIAVESFAVHKVGDGWIEMTLSTKPEETFNLLDLQNGVTMELAEEVTMPVGEYNRIRLAVGSAEATFEDQEGSQELEVPPGYIGVITRFEIEDEGITVLEVDMEPDWVAISANNSLRPVIKASVVGQAPPNPEQP